MSLVFANLISSSISAFCTVGLGEQCTRRFVKCERGSVCLNGLCSCMPGTILEEDRCKKRITGIHHRRVFLSVVSCLFVDILSFCRNKFFQRKNRKVFELVEVNKTFQQI